LWLEQYRRSAVPFVDDGLRFLGDDLLFRLPLSNADHEQCFFVTIVRRITQEFAFFFNKLQGKKCKMVFWYLTLTSPQHLPSPL
jgi:hypothetical protein